SLGLDRRERGQHVAELLLARGIRSDPRGEALLAGLLLREQSAAHQALEHALAVRERVVEARDAARGLDLQRGVLLAEGVEQIDLLLVGSDRARERPLPSFLPLAGGGGAAACGRDSRRRTRGPLP